MADEPSFLHRWSRRKHEAARAVQAPPETAAPASPAIAPAAAHAVAPATAAPAPAPAPAPAEPAPLPPIESLTLESDFTPFLTGKVEETVKRAAMRKLFSDPHFNVMDGLDIYIDDYTKPDPMPEGFLDKLADVYKTIEEKTAEPAPGRVAQADAPLPAAEPPPQEDQEPDEHQG